jgi:hypothetical protein
MCFTLVLVNASNGRLDAITPKALQKRLISNDISKP